MAHIRFYGNLGCATNARQKAMLIEAGHMVEALSLLTRGRANLPKMPSTSDRRANSIPPPR